MSLWAFLFALCLTQVYAMSLGEVRERRAIDGSLRLTKDGRESGNVGRLEIYYKGRWGAVCDDKFDSVAATVACRDMGKPGAEMLSSWQFGETNNFLINEVSCSGAESRLTQCRFIGWGNTGCKSHETVGLRCGVSPSGSGRFKPSYTSGGRKPFSSSGGRIPFSSSGGRKPYSSSSSHSSSSSSHHYSSSNRGGSSGSSVNLPRPGFDQGGFTGGTSGGFMSNMGPAKEGSIRLVDRKGMTGLLGRLEVFHNGEWGTVCKDRFDDRDLRVVCRQLGMDGDGLIKPPSWFGPGLGKIWMTRAECAGNEEKLTGCPYTGWGVSECRHSEDVGVECFSSHESHHSRVNY